MEKELIEKIDRYFRGELTAEEKFLFEHNLKNDPVFAQTVKEHSEFISKLKAHNRHKEFRNKLNEFHEEMKKDKKIKKDKNIFRLNTSYLAMAASIAAIVITAFSFYLGFFNSDELKVNASYQELSVKMEKIEETQEDIIKNISEDNKAQSLYAGTGFLISQEGYILTSYHLVKGAKKITVENKIAGKLKAEKIFENAQRDCAILKVHKEDIKSLGRIPFSVKGKNTDLAEKIFTLGFPESEVVYGEGTISSVTGFKGDSLAYRISIPVNPGNSGGPVFDESGNIIGIISGKQTDAELANFAVKTKYILEFIDNQTSEKITPSKKNSISSLKRSDMVKKVKPFIFNVRVY